MEFYDSEHVSDEPIDCAVLWGQSRLGELTQSQTQMPHLSSRSDIKGSPRIDKSYLLRLSCSKPHRHDQDVTYNLHSRPRDSSTRHSCDTTTFLSTQHYEVISDWQLERKSSYKDVNQYHNSLAKCISWHCFLFDKHHGIPRRRFLAGHRQNHGTGWSSDSFPRYLCSLGEIA